MPENLYFVESIFIEIHCYSNYFFCLIELRAMIVVVQQPSAECTAIFTVRIAKYRPPACVVTIHKTRTDQQRNGFQNSARIQDQRSMCWQHTKHFDLSQ